MSSSPLSLYLLSRVTCPQGHLDYTDSMVIATDSMKTARLVAQLSAGHEEPGYPRFWQDKKKVSCHKIADTTYEVMKKVGWSLKNQIVCKSFNAG